MSVKTKSIYDEKEPSDGTRILISRFYPRGVKRTHFDLWIRDASPEKPLLKEYRDKAIDWKVFSKKFRDQLKSSPSSLEAIKKIEELAKKDDVTLLCYEREGQKCHRLIVKSVVNQKTRKKSSSKNEESK